MSKITYQRVAQLCNQMELLGNKPSVRKIIAELGGSFTLVAEYLKQWREEKELAQESEMPISQELQQAILAEYALVANKVKQGLEAKISELTLDLTETEEELSSSLSSIKKLEARIAELERTIQDNALTYEKKISADASTIEFLKGEKQNLHTLLGEANKLRHEAELREAIANTKVEALGK
ncbi:DNA-binding protein [Legionella pneumophila serogroup 1]